MFKDKTIKDWLVIVFLLYLSVSCLYSAYLVVTVTREVKECKECEESKRNFVPIEVPGNDDE